MLQYILLLCLLSPTLQGLKIPQSAPADYPDPPIPLGDVMPPPIEGKSPVNSGPKGWGFGYGGYGGYGGGGRGRVCRDWWGRDYCTGLLRNGKCHNRYYVRGCRLTCGICKQECTDISSRCEIAGTFMCSQPWFSRGCRKTCNLCPTTVMTTVPVTTAESATPFEKECKDDFRRCRHANRYRCSRFGFQNGCKLSCGICKKEMTTTIPTTTEELTTTTNPECEDNRDDCNDFLDYSTACSDEFMITECRKTCGMCEDITTPFATTIAEETTDIEIDTLATTWADETTTIEVLSTAETTESSDCFDARGDCDTYIQFAWFCMVPSIAAECRKKCEMCGNVTAMPPTTIESTSTKKNCHKTTTEPTTTTTSTTLPSTTSTTTTESKSTTTPTPETEEPDDCEDVDEDSCKVWKSLGFCYNDDYKEEMEETCMKTCEFC